MKKSILTLFCFSVFFASCFNAENTKTNDAAKTNEGNRQQASGSPSSNSDQSTPQPVEPNVSQSPPIVNANGQNITYSTEGELDIVGTEINYDIILPSDILFDFDKHELRPEAGDLLQKLKAHFVGRKTNQVHVFGHTDSKGDDQYNAVLSQKSAVAVQKWLKENTDVYAMALGMGEREALVPNENPGGSDNPENRQRNGRVTIRVALYPGYKSHLPAFL